MTAPLRFEYCLALRDSGYPQPEFAEGQTWYKVDTAMQSTLDADWIHRYRVYWAFRAKVNKSELAYSPGFVELAKAANVRVRPSFVTIEELADIWLAQTNER